MKTERYICAMVVLLVGLFLMNAFLPEATFAQNENNTTQTCVQRSAPANTWCAPATSGGTVCTTYVPDTKAPRIVVKQSETPLDVVATILAAPFVLAQCIVAGCP